jgi:hypothetical protein
MKVYNVHQRLIDAPAAGVGALLDGLASPDDRLWPHDRWPRMQLDGPLAPGAAGGHGPIGYVVDVYEPGRLARFRFTRPPGFIGHHRFELEPVDADRTILRHVIEMDVAGRAYLAWALAIRHLHDALLEDALDRAERAAGHELELRRHSAYVRTLRRMLSRRRAGSQTRPGARPGG